MVLWLCAHVGTWQPQQFYSLPEWLQWLWLEYAALHMPPPPKTRQNDAQRAMRDDQADLQRWLGLVAEARARNQEALSLREWVEAGRPDEVTRGRPD